MEPCFNVLLNIVNFVSFHPLVMSDETVKLDSGDNLKHRHLFLDTLVAGCFAGFLTEALLFPVESLKFCLQMGLPVHVRGLWKGYVPSVLGSGPSAAMFLYTYNTVKYYIQPHVTDSHNYRVHVLAACCGEAVSLILKVPTDNVKHRRLVYSNAASSISFVRRMVRRAGLASVFAGYRPQLLSKVHSSLVIYPVWEGLMARTKRETGQEDLDPNQVAACGAVAAGVVGALTNPFDVARSRLILAELRRLRIERLRQTAKLQVEAKSKQQLIETQRARHSGVMGKEELKPHLRGVEGKYGEMDHVRPDLGKMLREFLSPARMPELYRTMGAIYQEKGIMGLFAGTVARTARITLGGAVFFYAYASAMEYLARKDHIEHLEERAIVILESGEEKVEEFIETIWHTPHDAEGEGRHDAEGEGRHDAEGGGQKTDDNVSTGSKKPEAAPKKLDERDSNDKR